MKVMLDFAMLTSFVAIALGITFPRYIHWFYAAKDRKNFSLVFIKSIIYYTLLVIISYVVFMLTFVSGPLSSQVPNWIFVIVVFLLFLASEAAFEDRFIYSNQRSREFLKVENSDKNKFFEIKIRSMDIAGAVSFLYTVSFFYIFITWIYDHQIYQNIFFVCWNLIGGMTISVVSIFIWKIAARL